MLIGEVLARYADDRGPSIKSRETLVYAICALAGFWDNLTCDAVKGTTCGRYQTHRARPRDVVMVTRTGKQVVRKMTAGSSTVRRELGVLQAALRHAHREGLLIHEVSVTLPAPEQTRDRWLTRLELAQLLRHAEPHVQRFILLSIYTGRRAAAILELTWARVDLEAGKIRFLAEGQVETNKRRGQVVIPRQLKAHLGRWQKQGGSHVVAFRSLPVASIRRGIHNAARRAGLEGVTPHVLKHTAITWAVMKGVEIEDAAEYFNTSPEMIRKHYWHHSPHHQARAVEIIERR